MSNTKHCAECGALLPAYWPKGLCIQCALDGALDMTNAGSQVPQPKTPTSPGTPTPAPLSAASSPLGSFGDYDLLDEIARGGMGVVYRARQRNLGRIVAVKMILAGPLAGKEFVQRFRIESAAAAILQHPNIVAIHDVGVHDGRHYFSMDYVEGQSLAKLVGQQPLSPARAARYVELIAEAIHYAHERGILHRDLKPSNVLIDANDQPRITDFGLARRLDGDSSLTLSGQVLGSPNFMPPEQAGGRHGKAGRPSDVYALGGVLYYLLTARAPFQADSLEHLISQVLDAEPVSPRLLNPSIPRDLETITLKCLEKDPSRRYKTAQEFADELDRFLRHEPIHARPLTSPEKLWRWGQRKPVMALLIVLLHLVGAVGLTGIVWQWRRAEHNAKSERKERDVAVEQRKLADMQLALQAWEEGDLQRANDLIAASRPVADQPPGFEWRYLTNLCQDQSIKTFGANHPYRSAQFFDRNLLLFNDEKKLTLHNLSGGEDQLLLEDPDGIWRPTACSGNTNLLATVTDDSRIKVWDLAAGRVLVVFEGHPRSSIIDLTFSPDGKLLASAGGEYSNRTDNSVKLWDVESRNPQVLRTFYRYSYSARGVRFSADGRQLFSSGTESMIRVWDVATGAEAAAPLEGQTAWGGPLAISPNGLWMASGNGDSTIIVWNLTSRKLERRLFGHSAPVHSLAISPDRQILASGGWDHTIRLWDLKTGRQLSLLRGHGDWLNWLSFSPDGQRLASQSKDGLVKLWPATTGLEANALTGKPVWLQDVALSPDGRHVASVASGSSAVHLWDLTTLTLTLLNGHSSETVMCVAFSPDGRMLATGSHDQTVRLWDVGHHSTVAVLTNVFPVGSLAFSPDGRTLIVGGSSFSFLEGDRDRGGLQFWDVRSQQATETISGDTSDIVELALSASGSLLTTGHKDGAVSLWDAQTRQLLHRFGSQFRSPVISLAFSPTEPLLAASDQDGNIVLYNTTNMEVLSPPLKAHTWRVMALAFSLDGRTLASAGEGGGLKLWNVATRQVALTLKGHAGSVCGIAFSRDGNLLVSCGADATVRLWPAAALEKAGAATKTKSP